MRILYILFFLLFIAFGCRVGPRYHTPSAITPSQWKAPLLAPTLTATCEHWWEIFQDSCLNDLELKLIKCNYRYDEALQKVAEARAVAGVSKSDLYPHLSLNANYQYSQDLVNIHGLHRIPITGLKNQVHIRDRSYSFPNIFNYELDLWGKYRGTYNANLFNAQSLQEQARSILLTLTSELASNYFNLRTLDSDLAILKKKLDFEKKRLNFHNMRYKTGITNALDVSYSMGQLANIEAIYEDTLRQRNLFENAIATLIGTSASTFSLPTLPLAKNLPSIPVDLPSFILIRRPDIAEAERKMASKHALINVAYSSFFPSLALTAGGGLSSVQLKDFLNFKGYLWQVGANLVQSIFDAGKNRSNLNASKASFQQAEKAYQQLVLHAFQEVEDALNNVALKSLQEDKLKQAVEAAQWSLSLSSLRLNKGLINQLEVINNEISLLNEETHQLRTLGDRYQSTIELIKALGGGWTDSR